MAALNESDEAFARRLQAQELGGNIDAQTPLMLVSLISLFLASTNRSY